MRKMIVHHWAIRLFMPPLFGAIVYLLVLMVFDTVAELETVFLSEELILCIIIGYLFTEGNHWVIRLVNAFLQSALTTTWRFIIQALVTLGFTYGIVFAAVKVYFEEYQGTQVYDTELNVLSLLWLIMGVLYLLLYFSALLHARRNEAKLDQELNERRQLEYRVQAFNQEINPELLYASLESLISLMHQNSTQADDHLQRLSSVYRYILDRRREDLVSVRDEVEAAKNLVSLMNPSRQGQVSLHVELKAALMDEQLVPGTLPILLEHVVRSNIITTALPLDIYLRSDDDYLVIENRLCQRLQPLEKDQRMQRLQEAYSYFTTRPLVEVKVGEDQYLKVPMLQFEMEEV